MLCSRCFLMCCCVWLLVFVVARFGCPPFLCELSCGFGICVVGSCAFALGYCVVCCVCVCFVVFNACVCLMLVGCGLMFVVVVGFCCGFVLCGCLCVVSCADVYCVVVWFVCFIVV